MHTVAVVSIVISCLQVLMGIIIYPFYFKYSKQQPIIKARSQVLEFAQLVTSVLLQVRCLLANLSHEVEIPCLLLIWSVWFVCLIFVENLFMRIELGAALCVDHCL